VDGVPFVVPAVKKSSKITGETWLNVANFDVLNNRRAITMSSFIPFGEM
jgi:hypothetical protein